MEARFTYEDGTSRVRMVETYHDRWDFIVENLLNEMEGRTGNRMNARAAVAELLELDRKK